MFQRFRSSIFTFLLFSSGLCGISYEILYGRILGNIIGDQFAVSAAILLTFLLGIGFGTLYAHRLWAHLWLLEAGIGLYGALFALGSGLMDKLLYSSFPLVTGGLTTSILVCVVLLIVPAFLIGTSLPIFAGYLSRMKDGPVFSRAYAFYNFGAAFTALFIEFWLVRWLGIRDATLVIAVLNGVVAFSLIAGYKDIRSMKPESRLVRGWNFPWFVLAALAFASVGSAIFQLLMVKVAECIMGPFRETFAVILFLVLLGIALGSLMVKKFRVSFPTLMILNLAGLAWLLGGFTAVTEFYAANYPAAVETYTGSVLLKTLALAILMGVPVVTFGATIPALLKEQENVARESGQLLFVSSVANAFGFLILAFYLHERFDYGVLFLVIGGLSTAAVLVHQKKLNLRTGAVVILFLAAVGFQAGLWDEDLLYIGYTSYHSTEDLEEGSENLRFPDRFKGPQDIFSITWFKNRPYFFINGYISIPLDASAEKIVGAFSSVFAPRNDRALVLGLGSGATANTVGLLFDHTDGVEINGVVLENLFRMKEYNFDIESNPKVSIIHDDAIHFVKAGTGTYSLIINTVTTPLYFSSSKLYTRDFIEAVKKRLTPDGVYMTWIDSRIGDRGVDILLKTLGQSFSHCVIGAVRSAYFLLLCSQEPVRAHQADIVADNPLLGPYFLEEYDINPEWIAYGLLNTNATNLVGDRDVPVNTLDYPALEFEMARLRKRGYREFQYRLRDSMRIAPVRAALSPMVDWNPVHLVLYLETLLEESRYVRRWKELVAQQDPDFEKRYNEASIELSRQYAATVNTATAYHHLGFLLMKDEQYPEAIAMYRRALELDSTHDNTHFNIGACYEYMELYPEALEEYRLELTVDPRDSDVSYRAGRVLVKMKQYKTAVDELTKALREDEKAAVFYYRGLALEKLGRRKEARRDYLDALSLDPEYFRAREALDRLADD
ncbi:MAG: tetratricopeptide repeat protein [Chlorobi bacterium]|nr:tetratricopeptide repeat protein [Chlorobiota bacterium]